MNATVDHYTFAASLSEATLLQTMAEMGRARNLDAMTAFLDFLDASAANSQPMFSGNVSNNFSLRQRPDDEEQYVGNGIATLHLAPSDLLTMVLAPAVRRFSVGDHPDSHDVAIQDLQRLSSKETAYLHRLASMIDVLPDGEWINDLGFSLVQQINDPEAVEAFTNGCSLTTESRRSYRHFMNGGSGNETSLAEQALSHGNLAIVPQLLRLLDDESISEVLKCFIYERADQNESLRLMDLAVREQPDKAIAIVEAMEERLGIDEISNLRIRVIEAHLRHSINDASAVNVPAMIDLVGPTQAHRDAVEMLCRIHTGKNLAMAIVGSHTHELMPLISAGLTILPGSEPHRAIAEIKHAIDDQSRTITGQHDADRMKKTILFMVERGQTLSMTQDNQSALRCLAKTTPSEDRTAKLAVLLALGDDPQKKDYQGKIPSSHLKPAMRKEWDSVCKSFAARRAAHSILDEMDVDVAPARMSP